jgi:predicted GNAT family acetyltransferase
MPPPAGRDRVRAQEIDPRFEGQGLASKLIQTALSEARALGAAVLPFCPFVPSYSRRGSSEVE